MTAPPRRGGGPLRLPEPEDPGGKGLYRPNRKLVYGLLAVIAVLVTVRVASDGGRDRPLVPTSCSTPALGLGTATVPSRGLVRFTVTGPQQDTYAVWVDAAAARRGTDGQLAAVPLLTGRPAALLAPPLRLSACTLTTARPLAPGVTAGSHEVALFRVTADGAEAKFARAVLEVS